MKKRTEITLADHYLYSDDLEKMLDYIYDQEPYPEPDTEFGHDLNSGFDYLCMLGRYHSNYEKLKLVDKYVAHYHFGIETDIPLKDGEERMRCMAIAILTMFNKRIPGAIIETSDDGYYVATPFMDGYLPLVYHSVLIHIMASKESLADYYLKILEFHMVSLCAKEVISSEGKGMIEELTVKANKRFDGLAIFNDEYSMDCIGIMEDFALLISTRTSEYSKGNLTKELSVFYGNYLINKFGGEWVTLDGNEWNVFINKRVMAYPFSVVEKCICDSDPGLISSDLNKLEILVSGLSYFS